MTHELNHVKCHVCKCMGTLYRRVFDEKLQTKVALCSKQCGVRGKYMEPPKYKFKEQEGTPRVKGHKPHRADRNEWGMVGV